MKYYLFISLSVLPLEDTNIDSVVFVEPWHNHLGRMDCCSCQLSVNNVYKVKGC